MYTNMSYPFIPDPNLMFSNKYMDIEQNVKKLEREVKRLEHRVSVLERNKTPYVTTTQNENIKDDDGMYMM